MIARSFLATFDLVLMIHGRRLSHNNYIIGLRMYKSRSRPMPRLTWWQQKAVIPTIFMGQISIPPIIWLMTTNFISKRHTYTDPRQHQLFARWDLVRNSHIPRNAAVALLYPFFCYKLERTNSTSCISFCLISSGFKEDHRLHNPLLPQQWKY